MHELSVTEGILKICLDEGKKHNIEKIKKIWLHQSMQWKSI